MEAPTPDSSTPTEEIEVWWGSYALRATIPSCTVAAALTVGMLVVVWVQGGWKGEDLLQLIILVPILGVWLFVAIRWGYRLVAVSYRLTTRRLFCERGFLRPVRRVIDLVQIDQVLVAHRGLDRLLRIGRVRIVALDRKVPDMNLDGIHRPEHIAMKLRKYVQKARQTIDS
jgi:membrane protein YdbS with pleckstrin-like domain